MEKKGQLTLFIILGIVFLLIISFFTLVKTGVVDSPFDRYPREAMPFVEYTESCLEEIAGDGAFLLGAQGGYIRIPGHILVNPKARIEEPFTLPYWYYRGTERIPSKTAMELELAGYIEEGILECLDSFEPFRLQYDVDGPENMTASAAINQKDIIVTLDMPLSIRPKGSEKTIFIDHFEVRRPSQLGRLYDLASSIMRSENALSFLELYADEMIAASDWLPYEGMYLGCEPQVWSVPEMEEYVKTMISVNLGFLMFENTDYAETGMPYYDKLYKIRVTDRNYKDVKVRTMYNPAWGMEFDVLPRNGQIVKPIRFTLSDMLGGCVKVYHHKYSMEFPVVFELKSRDRSEEPFYFATPVLVKYNMPNRFNEVSPLDVEGDKMSSLRYCANFTDVTLFETGPEGMIISTPSNYSKRRHDLKVYAVDGLRGFPDGALANVSVEYQCIRYVCEMGVTSYPADEFGQWAGEFPQLRTGFPECGNGVVIGKKEGYWRARVPQSVGPYSDGDQVTLGLYPLKTLDFHVKVMHEHNGILQERLIEPGETALITISNDEEGFEKTLIYPSDSPYYTNLSLVAKDIPYTIDIMLTQGEALVGGAMLNWTVRPELLLEAGTLELFAYRKDIQIYEGEEELYKAFEESLNKSRSYKPRLI